MAGPEEIVQMARSSGIQASLVTGLDPIRTAVEAADAVDRPIAQFGNTVLVTVGDQPVLVVVPGDRRLDGGLVAQEYGAEALKVSLASRQEIREATGYNVSLLPPFGLEDVDVLVDEHLLEHETILLPTGDARSLVEIDPQDLRKLPNATVGIWSVPREDVDA